MAQPMVAGIYTALAAIALTILWAMRRTRTKPSASPLAHQRETQLVMLVEAAMLGYELARKGTSSR